MASEARPTIFLSYSGDESLEADLLKYAIEHELRDVRVWTYERDQRRDEGDVPRSLKEGVKSSCAVLFLITPSTLETGATQWMELAYADAFEVPTFILLHRLSYADLKAKDRVPPLVLAKQCTQAKEWRTLLDDLRKHCAPGAAGAGEAGP
jgi:hypothetical protein